MLRSFEVENYLSVKDRQVVKLAIHKSATDADHHFASTPDKIRLPKVVAIIGANGAGKTSFLRVPRFLAEFIVNSAGWPANVEIPVVPFLSKETIDLPSDFAIEFDMAIEPNRFAVFEYRLRATKEKVLFESLHYSPLGKSRRLLFARDHTMATPHHEYGPDFRDNVLSAIPTSDIINIKDRASLIAVLAQYGHKNSVAIQRAASMLFTNVPLPGQLALHPYWYESAVTQVYRGEKRYRDTLIDFIRLIDLGIEDIDFGEMTTNNFDPVHVENSLPTFIHENLSRKLTFPEESHGTRALYTILLPIIRAIDSGGIAILDEFDSDIHPMVIPKIIELFQSNKYNPGKAQLIFCGHNPYTLSSLEKEEVYFAEKSSRGASRYFGLRDVKGVRRSDRYFTKYLSGIYGGTPNV